MYSQLILSTLSVVFTPSISIVADKKETWLKYLFENYKFHAKFNQNHVNQQFNQTVESHLGLL